MPQMTIPGLQPQPLPQAPPPPAPSPQPQRNPFGGGMGRMGGGMPGLHPILAQFLQRQGGGMGRPGMPPMPQMPPRGGPGQPTIPARPTPPGQNQPFSSPQMSFGRNPYQR